MKNALFSRLLNLYASPVSIEKFMTEVLAGILRSEQNLLDKFVNTVLTIKGTQFQVETDQSYGDIKPSMSFFNNNSLCFLENKVESFEEHGQLAAYKNFLHAQPPELKVYLRYCTQYYEKKNIKDINFKQFFWVDIYNFLTKSYSTNSLVQLFLDFLKERNMNQITELNFEDLVAIGNLAKTIEKMDICLDSIAAEMTELFGNPNIGAPPNYQERLRDLGTYKQYHMSKHPLLQGGSGEWGWSDIRISFAYNEESTQLIVWYWCGRTHSQYELLKKLIRKHQRLFINFPGLVIEEMPNWLVIAVKKPLVDFYSEPKPLQAIQDWLSSILPIFRKFADKTPEFHWNIPK